MGYLNDFKRMAVGRTLPKLNEGVEHDDFSKALVNSVRASRGQAPAPADEAAKRDFAAIMADIEKTTGDISKKKVTVKAGKAALDALWREMAVLQGALPESIAEAIVEEKRAPKGDWALVQKGGTFGEKDRVLSAHKTKEAAQDAMRKKGGEPDSQFTKGMIVVDVSPSGSYEIIPMMQGGFTVRMKSGANKKAPATEAADMGKAIPGKDLLGGGKPMKGKEMNPENRAALEKLLWAWADGEEASEKKESRLAEADDAEIAKTIAMQMGGKLKAMLGATLMAVPSGLKIKWPQKKRSLGNVCVVTLRPDDTYDMEFFNGDKSVKKFEGLYADALKPAFEKHTGWFLSL